MPYPPSNPPPEKLSARHELAAFLTAAGRKQNEIIQVTGFSQARISIIQNSPLFKAYVKQLQEELKNRTFDEVLDRINAEAIPTLNRLTELRDHGTKEDSVRLGAAQTLLKYVPALRKLEEEDAGPKVTLRLERSGMALVALAIAEDEGRTIDVTELAPEQAPVVRATRTIDELLEEMTYE